MWKNIISREQFIRNLYKVDKPLFLPPDNCLMHMKL